MIATFTDFGHSGPYLGQMHAVIERITPGMRIVDLFSDAPVHNPRASAYLLASYYSAFPPGTVFLCVVDPGVGSFQHQPVAMRIDERYFVGPDNGLFNTLKRHQPDGRQWPLCFEPRALSASFHGRDLYAPAAARLAAGAPPAADAAPYAQVTDWPADLSEVVYIDHFGNAITGLRPGCMGRGAVLKAGRHDYRCAHTYAEVEPGEGFWYVNANGLVEIAINQGRAADEHGLSIGQQLLIMPGD